MESNENIKNNEFLNSEKVRNRMYQSSDSRLVEYLIGVDIWDDQKLESRIKADKSIIRNKYGLPDESLKIHEPDEYYRLLTKIAKKNNYDVRDIEFAERVGTGMVQGAVHYKSIRTIATRKDDSSGRALLLSIQKLEHELTHALQGQKYPELIPEVAEYEAYVATMLLSEIDSTNIRSLFRGGLMASIGHKYEQRFDGQRPEWNNPFWFLNKIDGIDIDKPKFIPVGQLNKNIFDYNPKKGVLNQVENILHKLVGEKWEPYFREILYYRLEFDRSEIRTRYGLPKFRGSSMERYVEGVLEIARSNEIELKIKDTRPENFNEWMLIAEDLDEQFIRKMQFKQNLAQRRPKFQLEYEAFVGGCIKLSDYGGLTSELAWYMDDKKPYEY